MIKALGWIMVAIIVSVVSKKLSKILFPEDWENEI